MAQSLSESIQQSRMTVVEVDKSRGRLRVRGMADVCTDLSCSEHARVVTDEEVKADLDFLNPGDIVKIEPGVGKSRSGLTSSSVTTRACSEQERSVHTS